MLMDEQAFRTLVSSALSDLSLQVDRIDSDAFETRLADGVFQVDFEGGGVFVLSPQVPVRELWLSAFSRAWHFRYVDGAWLERDSGEALDGILSAHFTRRLGQPVGPCARRLRNRAFYFLHFSGFSLLRKFTLSIVTILFNVTSKY